MAGAPREALLKHLRPRHIGLGLVVFILLTTVVLYSVRAERQRLHENLQARVVHHATQLLTRLESELHSNIFLAQGLVAHIVATPNTGNAEFTKALAALFRAGRYLRNIGVAPNNRISNVYPLEGNANAIGAYYPDLPDQWPSVRRAMELHTTVLGGPVQLRQGGTGLISRTPVYLDNGQYWGVISLVLDPASLWQGAGLYPELGPLEIAIRGADAMGAEGRVFFGNPALFDQPSLRFDIEVPGGSWQMAAYPSGGWNVGQAYLDVVQALGLILSALLSLALVLFQRSRHRLAASEHRLSAILETTPDGVLVVDEQRRIHEFNRAAEVLFGYTADEVVGQDLGLLIHSRQPGGKPDTAATQPHADLLPGQHQYVGHRSDGTEFPVEATAGSLRIDGTGYMIGVFRDLSERLALEAQLRKLATTDALTGAMNRRAFIDVAEKAFQVARRHSRPLSLLMIDADHFKRINDTYGHHAGDRVLVTLAAVTLGTLRSTDVFCRFGGEEFLALLPETGPVEATNMAERLLIARRRIRVDAESRANISLTVSIGIASAHEGTRDLASLIRAADGALYQAKTQGRDQYRASVV